MNQASREAIEQHLSRLNDLLMECEPLVNRLVASPTPALGKELRCLYGNIEAEVRQGRKLF